MEGREEEEEEESEAAQGGRNAVDLYRELGVQSIQWTLCYLENMGRDELEPI